MLPKKPKKMIENGKQSVENPQNPGPHDQQGYGKLTREIPFTRATPK